MTLYECTTCGACCVNPRQNQEEGYTFFVEIDDERSALLTRKAPTVGHLAVLNVHLKRVLEVTSGLLSEAAYGDLCAARGLPGPRDT